MASITLITSIAALAFGLLGASLGILNTWHSLSRDTIRLRVRLVGIIPIMGVQRGAIEVTNLSYFPVTINAVGFTMRPDSFHMQVLIARTPGGESLPQRMEPRTQITVLLAPDTLDKPDFARAQRAYATTACGKRFVGSKKNLRLSKSNLGATGKQN